MLMTVLSPHLMHKEAQEWEVLCPRFWKPGSLMPHLVCLGPGHLHSLLFSLHLASSKRAEASPSTD